MKRQKSPDKKSPDKKSPDESTSVKINNLIQQSVDTVNPKQNILIVNTDYEEETSNQLTLINKNIMTVALTHKFTSTELTLIEKLPEEQRELFLILLRENKEQQVMIHKFLHGFKYVGDAIIQGAEKVVDQVAKSEENVKDSVSKTEENIKKQAEEIGNGLKNDLNNLKAEIISNVTDLKKQIDENKVTTMGQLASVMYGIFNGIKQGIIAIGLFFVWLHTTWWSWRDPVTGIIPTALSSMIPCWIILTSIFWSFLEWVLITMLIIDGIIYCAVNPVFGYSIDGVGEWLFQLPFIFGIIVLQRLWTIGNKVEWDNPIVKGIMNKLMQFIGYIGGKIAQFPLFAKIIYVCNVIFAALKTGYHNFTANPDLSHWFNELLKLIAQKLYAYAPSIWGGRVKKIPGITGELYPDIALSKQKGEQNMVKKMEQKTSANKNVIITIPQDMYNLAELKKMHEMLNKSRNDLKNESKPTMNLKWMNQTITLSPQMKGFLNMMLDIPVLIVEFLECAEKDVTKAIEKMNKTNRSRSRRSRSKSMHSNSRDDGYKRRSRSKGSKKV